MVDIERLAIKLPDIIYEPEQFPGAIYHARELEGASILIFASGKAVFAGLKSLESLKTARQVLTRLGQQTSTQKRLLLSCS
jgi:transcription initiation factor TFIID TATA-box-binding protein